jgi:hypothetical protein
LDSECSYFPNDHIQLAFACLPYSPPRSTMSNLENIEGKEGRAFIVGLLSITLIEALASIFDVKIWDISCDSNWPVEPREVPATHKGDLS